MASVRRPAGETTSSPATFSYAQAAKGISAANSAGSASKATSGAVTPAKEEPTANGVLPTTPSATSWAEDVATTSSKAGQNSESPTAAETTNGTVPPQLKPAAQPNTVPEAASSDFGTPSTSTLGKDDDVVSLPNATSSESTWEVKSQVSTPLEKPQEHPVDDQEKEKKEGKENNKKEKTTKPLLEAPLPVVNIWHKRAEESAKTKASHQPVPARTVPAGSVTPALRSANSLGDKSADLLRPDTRRKSKPHVATQTVEPHPHARKDRRQQVTSSTRPDDDEKPSTMRRESRPTTGPITTINETVAVVPLPPTKDQQSWPTVETAKNDERKKTLDRGEKDEKERTTSSAKPHGKNGWTTLDVQPNFIFETPLPNTSGRRGGRGGSRGGASLGTRSNSIALPNSETVERSNAVASANNEDAPRQKSENPSSHVRNESQSRRPPAASSGPGRELQSGPTFNERKAYLPENLKKSLGEGGVNDSTHSNHPSSNPTRTFPQGRARSGRKFDDRRRDAESNTVNEVNGSQYSRRFSSATQPDPDSSERKAQFSQDSLQGSNKQNNNHRNGQYNSHTARERGEGRQRGGARSGRGGNAFSNQNAYPAQSYGNTNGYSQPVMNGYYAPRSPAPSQHDPANAYFVPADGNSRHRNSTPRSQTMPDQAYGRMGNQFMPNGYAIPPISTFQPGYEYTTYPMSAGPYTGQPIPYPQEEQVGLLNYQLDYYFSQDNLLKDLFLRQNMDSQGFVLLDLIAGFQRIKTFNAPLEMIKMACYRSHVIEYRIGSDGKDRLRRKEGWEQYVLPVERRKPAAQNDGPESLSHPPIPHPQGFDPYLRQPWTAPASGPTSPGGFPRDAGFQNFENRPNMLPTDGGNTAATISNTSLEQQVPSQGIQDLSNGTAGHSNASKRGLNAAADSFSDEQIQSLTVVSRTQEQKTSSQDPTSMSSRTFSNGSIDDASQAGSSVLTNGLSHEKQLNGDLSQQGGAEDSATELSSTPSSQSSPLKDNGPAFRVYWVKGRDARGDSLQPGITCEPYTELHRKAFEQRQSAKHGVCPYDMDVLYQFWSHFLIRNFNTSMYNEFRHTAFEDCHLHSSDRGMLNLIKYYGEALTSSSNMRHRVARHFVDLIKSENEHSRLAFKQLRRCFSNADHNRQNRQIMENYIDSDLERELAV